MNYEPLFRYIEYNLKADNVLTFTQKIKMRQILSDIHKMTEDEAGELFDREADEWIADNSLETKRDVMSRSTFIKVMTEGGGNQDWISVEDKPKEVGFFNCKYKSDSGGGIHSFWFDGKDWCFDNWMSSGDKLYEAAFYVEVTHYQPLPPAPQSHKP